jgi:hypothetical protein
MARLIQACWALTGIATLGIVLQGSSPDAITVIRKAEARKAVRYFLNLDCSVTEPRFRQEFGALERILKLRSDEPEVELTLLSILRQGPDKKDMERARTSAEAEWTALKDFLAQNPDCCGLKEEHRKNLQGLLQDTEESKKSYVDQSLARLTRKYRERAVVALTALAAHGSAEADRAVREAENEGDKELKAVIAATRQQFGKFSETKRK